MTKIDDKIATAQEKLQETKQKFETTQKRDQELIKEKAKLKVEELLENKKDNKRIIEIDRQRDKLRSEIEIYPDLIREMELKVEILGKEKEEDIHKENLGKQKKAARKVEHLSAQLGDLLGQADEANIELQKCHSMYLKLHKLTAQDVFIRPTTSGSQGWLKVLAGIVKAELAGKGRPMPRYPGAAPPI